MVPILLIALLSLLAQLVLPWWSVALVAFAFCFGRPVSGGRSFLYSFLGVGLVWLGYALLQHSQSGGILTSRMSEVIKLPPTPIYLLVITPLLAGLVAGFAGLSGYWVRQTVLPTVAVKS
ncbi:hypothetical protein [Fibrella forsythiae]|uniref:Apolipoprotein N-acyltransferase n=1 Tax=Fibrella forsythiae TaxID=2817061 RepID=A0ABS3JE56_9BACT|nr:hypothetical protein [Fibrella forsythiae]MBO0948278.1 hypothetical protein [Fibrella forsythiae]